MLDSIWWLTTIVLILVIAVLVWRLFRVKAQLDKTTLDRSYVQALVDSIPDLTWVKDRDSRFLMVNRQFSRVFDLPVEDILGKTDEELRAGDTARRYMADDRMVMEKQEVLHREERIASVGGHESWAETVKVPIYGPHGEVVGTAGLARDISERKKAERSIKHLAHHDQLTDLPNRVLLEIKVRQSLANHDPDNDSLVVMFIDLDNFKIINDTINHEVGDFVLVELAKRLRAMVRKNDLVARIGGDEFVLVFPYTTLEQAQSLIKKVKAEVVAPVRYGEMTFEVTMSMGLSCFPGDGQECWELVKNADLAMYHAKQSGKNQAAVFSSHLADRSLQAMTLEARMSKALENNDFELYYQPKVDIGSGKIVGLEALLRWRDRDSGEMMLPYEFIAAAERSGFILRLGDWVINEVLLQLAQWQRQGVEIPVSINISAVQVHQNRIVDYIKRGLARHGLSGRLLELELTESVIMENSDSVAAHLNDVREEGVAISIDDFGTGYSNLAYLSKFPLNSLKIDRKFVQDIHLREDSMHVAGAIIELAKSMHLNLIAEGVELQAELTVLKQLGVRQAQGYLFDRPMPAEELGERLSADWAYTFDEH